MECQEFLHDFELKFLKLVTFKVYSVNLTAELWRLRVGAMPLVIRYFAGPTDHN